MCKTTFQINNTLQQLPVQATEIIVSELPHLFLVSLHCNIAH